MTWNWRKMTGLNSAPYPLSEHVGLMNGHGLIPLLWSATARLWTSSSVVFLSVCHIKLSQAERKFKPCVNGDMSFLWEALWLSGFSFPNRPGGHNPRPILTQNGSNDVPFGVKIATFWNLWPADLQNRQNLPNFDREFSLDFAFNIGGLTSKHT